MAHPYRGRSRHSESSSGSSHSPDHTQHHPAPPVPSGHYASAQHAYSASAQYGSTGASQSTYGYYSASPPAPLAPSRPAPGDARASLERVSMPHLSAAASSSERAPKRQRASAAPPQGAHTQVQRHSAPAQRDPRGTQSHSARGSRGGRESSVSSGYSSPGYHDPYAQQLFPPPAIPGVGPPAMRDAHLYRTGRAHNASSEYGEEEEEERLDHGPTELPPRTYSGKSKYDMPRKPGKIPGSAMDYLPILEARFDRLETAIDRYVDYRGQRALSNSILPGMDAPAGSSHHPRSSRQRDGA